MRRAVTPVGRGTTDGKEKWRAEVGPALPDSGLRFRFGLCFATQSFERLVFAEVSDGDAERIDGNQFIRNVTLEDEHKVGRVSAHRKHRERELLEQRGSTD